MSDAATQPVYEAALRELERRVLELTSACERQHKENTALRRQLQTLQHERSGLIEKHELAKQRVEAMIGRLRSLEESP
ncbi:TIGR02449 family protein [Acidihalobacter aeolianus]|uniref:TIGR02449 family protein n=1 Tax=Acidihalobacter aeolianus TaxID=2792603 RepID=A0A1D8KCI7_9GAMM|nr:TIGR02449 family protein [Acidihalobacter aeolianus]AOV18646.1 TIGR02449 family protein [Acidihalobacter aeolianus]